MFGIKMVSSVYGGKNSLRQIREIIEKKQLQSILIFTDKFFKKNGLLDALLNHFPQHVDVKVEDELAIEPSYQEVGAVAEKNQHFKADAIIGLGGGSVIDAAKLQSVLQNATYTIEDLLKDPTIAKKQIFSIMIPTTCGTGAEATGNAIVSIPEKEVKKGIVSEELVPDAVILDPLTVASLPKKNLAAVAIDTLCHGVECYTSKKANSLSNTFAAACTKKVMDNLMKAFADETDQEARSELLMAAYFGGVAIAGSGTTAVHALSYPLGGKFKIAHGVSNAILFVSVLKANFPDIKQELAELNQFVYGVSEGSIDTQAHHFIEQIDALVKKVGVPTSLDDFGISKDHLDFLVDSAYEQRRLLDNNKRDLTKDEIREIYLTLFK